MEPTEQQTEVFHQHHRMAQFYYVWMALLLITGFEVFLAYERLQPLKMLSILLGLSIIKAGLIIGYFMHLKFEVSRMRWVLMSALVICLALMTVFFPDAMRILSLGIR